MALIQDNHLYFLTCYVQALFIKVCFLSSDDDEGFGIWAVKVQKTFFIILPQRKSLDNAFANYEAELDMSVND